MEKVKYLIIGLLTFITINSFSQIYEFSKDPKTFQKEIKTFFKDYKAEDIQSNVSALIEYIDNEQFEADEFLRIVATANLMIQKYHLKPLPHFKSYVEILVAYKKHGVEKDKFIQYDNVFKEILKDSKRDLSIFNEAIYNLFSQRALYTTTSKTWFIYTNFYSIEYDKKVPYIIVKNPISLTCRTKEDTLAIHGTTGTYYPLKYKWLGSKGHVNWKRVCEDSSKVYAKLNTYKIQIRDSEFTADSVIFWNKRYFSSYLIGRYRDKALTTYNGKKALYPWFRSYKAVYILDKLSKNVLYVGGFTQEGLRITGTSSMDEFGPKQYAKIYISYKGQKILKATSDVFQITNDKIVASNSRVTIYYENDSIYHPKIIFNYSVDDRKLVLTRGSEGMARSPLFDTYHNLEMEFDQVEWSIDYPQMDFRMFRGSEGSAVFTSDQYFTMNKYIRTQGVLEFHPLNRIKKYSEIMDTNIFSVGNFSTYMGVRKEYLEPMLIQLTMEGYIIYHDDTGEILVRDKAFHFVNASNNTNDYDFLRMESTIKKPNAQFSLTTGNLEIEGVGQIMLSDTHRVFVYPKDQKLVMKNDRNFEFGGYVRAGLFEFFGDDFFFDYDNFKIDLKSIDSVRMYVKIDPNQPTLVAQIKSVLQNVSGTLQVDHPENKSGKINYPEYPIFDCTKNAYVYYDKKYILGGAYTRDRFYFKINPFTVDSLDKITMTGLEFEGTFHSGDILPVFDYKLVPQKDYSLGFSKTDIYPLYVAEGDDGKGKGEMTINLSNRGLRGNGTIEYLTSITKSDDFIFYFDSTRANSESFSLEHNAMGKYPKVQGTEVFSRWFPYADTMIIEKRINPFKIFEKELEFSGNLVLTPDQLTSSGTFNYKISIIKSKLFVFTPTHLLSDNANFNLQSNDPTTAAFIAPDAKMDLDVNTEITEGMCNPRTGNMRFPINQYETSMKKFTWVSLEDRVDIEKSEYQSDEKSYFKSLKKDQDSLYFKSTKAYCNLLTYHVFVEKIPYIASADAYIYPEDGKAVIEKEAFMQSLKNAKVKADTINFHHEIYDALINVFGKYKFTGYGMIDYVDKFKTKQPIKLHQIRVDESHKMFAKGNIHDSLKFFLHPKFRFGGYVEYNSTIREPDFDGHVKPFHDEKKLNTFWFQFHDRINPDSVYLSVNNPVGDDNRDLFTGMYVGTDSPYVYNVFMGKLKHNAHPQIFGISNGVLYYDDVNSKFVYGDVDKVFEDEKRGNYYTFEDGSGNIYAEGPIDFGGDIKAIDIKTAGNINYTGETGKYIFDIAMMVDFPFDEKALNRMADVLIEEAYLKKDTRENREENIKALSELIDDPKEREQVTNEIIDYGLFKPTKNFSSTLIFTDIKLTYNVETQMFESDESKIGLSSIKKTDIHKNLDGAMQITKRRSGTVFNFYFQTDDYNYYFFKYNYGIFNVLSSDNDFNDMVVNTASKNSAPKYRIKKGSTRDLTLFKKQMKLY